MNGDRGREQHAVCSVRLVAKTDKSWRKKCRPHKNDAIALITIDVSRLLPRLVFSTRRLDDKTQATCEMSRRDEN
jgi:hypothetical protein